jgi:hypothetical protein
MDSRDFFREEESSFCEQKEAKKLYPLAPASPMVGGCQWIESFLVLFFKKEPLPCLAS